MLKLARLACIAALGIAAFTAHADTYALMFGIGDYPDVIGDDGKPVRDKDGNIVDMDLAGPVNDVKTYKDLLVNKYGVAPDNVKLVLDKEANEKGFLGGLEWLISRLKPGDQVFFVYSGHGAQIDGGDEEDKKTEVIVLADNKLVPDDLFNQLANELRNAGVNATFVFDSCFSGGMSRDVFSFDAKPGKAKQKVVNLQAAMKRMKPVPAPALNAVKAKYRAVPDAPTKGEYAFLFGGREDQPTTDLDFKDPATPDHGLFTLVLTVVLDKMPDAPLEELMNALADILKEKGFEQKPTFEFSSPDRGKQALLLK